MIGNWTAGLRDVSETLRADGPAALWARLRLRDTQDYGAWLEERDIVCVIAALRRLSDRQLALVGMSHATLALDVEDLVTRAAAQQHVARDVLEVVGGRGDRMMAAE